MIRLSSSKSTTSKILCSLRQLFRVLPTLLMLPLMLIYELDAPKMTFGLKFISTEDTSSAITYALKKSPYIGQRRPIP